MQVDTKCRDESVLGRFLAGALTDVEAEVIAAHVLDCDHCAAIIDRLTAHDELFQTLRRIDSSRISLAPRPEVEEMIRRIRATRSPTDAQSEIRTQQLPGDTDVAITTSESTEQTRFDFLRPAEAPGELGRLAHYRVLQRIGEGGMGIVFLAEDVQLERPVAIKVLKPDRARDAAARQRFLREAKAAAAVQHENVVTIHEVGQDAGTTYLAMEWLTGQTLEAFLADCPRPAVSETLRIGCEIAVALHAAHSHGLVHRDIKPANVWLEERALGVRGSGLVNAQLSSESALIKQTPATLTPNPPPLTTSSRVKLLDFGLARIADDPEHLTSSGLFVGTPGYLAPEQVQGDAPNPRSDLFGLGCVLYRMCTGEAPFRGTNVLAVLGALASHTPTPVRELNADVPAELADLIEWLLKKDPADRPASAALVARRLREINEKGTHSPGAEFGHGSGAASTGDSRPEPLQRIRTGSIFFSSLALRATVAAAAVLVDRQS